MNKGFLLQPQGDLHFYTIPAFTAAKLVAHGFTTRHGGISRRPYESLNLAYHVGDDPEHVTANRKTVAAALGFNPEHLVTAEQVHSDRILAVTAEHTGRGAIDYSSAIPATDALITDLPGVPIATFYADCVPVFVLDPVRKAIGLAHAGWKGTVLKIAQKTVHRMSEIYGTYAADCLIGIAPSIGPCCYEVDNTVYNKFANSWQEDPLKFLMPAEPGKWRLDLWTANLNQLLEVGVRQENVDISRICTCCNPKTLFSHRGENGRTGRMGAYMMLT